MRNFRVNRNVLTSFVIFVTALWLSISFALADSAILTIESVQSVTKGGSFAAKVNIENVTNLAGFRLDIDFDPGILEAVRVDEGTFLSSSEQPPFCTTPNIDNITGVITGILCHWLRGQSEANGSGTLATITFNAVGTGRSHINLLNVKLLDTAKPDRQEIPVTVVDGSVDVVLAVLPAPVVLDIPDQIIEEGGIFADISLDDYVSDPDNESSEIVWTYSGNAELSVIISDDRIATITVPDPEWSGNETIAFTATDPAGMIDSDTATFTAMFAVETDMQGDWSLEGRFISYSSLCNIPKPVLSPRTLSGDASTLLTTCITLEEELGDPLALVVKIRNSSHTSQVLRIPFPSDVKINYGDVCESAYVLYYVWEVSLGQGLSIFGTPWLKWGRGTLETKVAASATIELMYLIPRFSGKATIKFGDIGFFIATSSIDIPGVNDPPIASDIPDQTIERGSVFASIRLDQYVSDPDNGDAEITWIYSGNLELSVSIGDDRIANITAPDTMWAGSETITFTATDPGGLSDSNSAKFTLVIPPPMVSDIPDRAITEGGTFADISLDDYVSDPDNESSEIVWTYSGNVELSVIISDDRIATITVPDPEWSGNETITFTATDPDGLTDSDSATYTVTPVNDPPVVSDIPNQTITEGSTFADISLDDYVSDPDNESSEIVWTYSGNAELSVIISDDRIATITVPDPEWSGSETITFMAADPNRLRDNDSTTLTVLSLEPVVSDIPNQTITEGSIFTDISLDDCVSDPDNENSEIAWTYSGNAELSVSISDDRIAIITVPDPEWSGSEIITFTATDPDGLSDSDSATFTVTPVNDPPVVSDIPDQTIEVGDTFARIRLDDYVYDPDNAKPEITWTYSGNVELSINIFGTRAAGIFFRSSGWIGSETITFTATDPDGLSDSDTATFTVTAVNDPPVVSDIPDQTIVQGGIFANIPLDDYVADADNEDVEIVWTYTGNVDLSVSISDDRVATIAIPDPEWFGSETITFTATDPSGLSDNDTATFTVTAVNDPPVVSDIPDQTIVQGGIFANISLDDYVSDPDNEYVEIVWTYTGNVDLSVSVSDARVATIAIPDPEWFGSETITFTATDPDGLSDSKDASFTVFLLGDVNNDGAVRSNDAILTLRFAAGLLEPTEDQKLAADMTKDGRIASNDAIRILRKAAGLGAPGAGYVASSAGPVTVSLTEAHGAAGESVTVPLKVDNFAGLAGGDIRIAYDPAVLKAMDVLPGSAKESEKLLVANLAEPGMVHISFAGSDSLSSKMLASIKFQVLADDVSPLMFKSIGIYGFNALPLVSKGVDEVFRSWAIPAEYTSLLQNYPNPFNPETWVPFQLKEGSKVTIRIYSSAGNLVRELDLGYRAAGLYVSQDRAAYWDGRNEAGEYVSSGLYFYSIQTGRYNITKKMTIVR